MRSILLQQPSKRQFNTMTQSDAPSPGSQGRAFKLAYQLSDSSLFLFLIWVVGLAPQLLALAPLKSAWKDDLIAAILEFAIFPFLGLVVLYIAKIISPNSNRIQKRLDFSSRVAIGLAVFYLILIPVQISIGFTWTQFSIKSAPLNGARQKTINEAETVLSQFSNSQELFDQLEQLLMAPSISPSPASPEIRGDLSPTNLKLKLAQAIKTAKLQLKVDQESMYLHSSNRVFSGDRAIHSWQVPDLAMGDSIVPRIIEATITRSLMLLAWAGSYAALAIAGGNSESFLYQNTKFIQGLIFKFKVGKSPLP